MDNCPRCNLPQKGINKCQYCGYDLTKYNKRPTKIIQKKFKNIINGFKQRQIVSRNKISKVRSMNNTGKAFKWKDNREKRSGTDRRKHHYANFFPERRLGVDRRK
jgi:primosomal protein N'